MPTLSFPPPSEGFARARARFVRAIVESLDETGRGLKRVRVRLSDRLNIVLSQVVTDADPNATLSLDDAESLLIEADVASGKSFGSALEGAGRVLALQREWLSRAVSPRADIEHVLDELRTLLSRAVVGAPLVFEAVPTATGVSLGLGIGARPRSARVLGHMAKGFVQAASDVLRATLETRLEVTRDRATLRIEHPRPKESDPTRPALRRPSSVRFHAVQGPVSAQVHRILGVSESSQTSTPGRDPSRS